jgi:hypothetical protein
VVVAVVEHEAQMLETVVLVEAQIQTNNLLAARETLHQQIHRKEIMEALEEQRQMKLLVVAAELARLAGMVLAHLVEMAVMAQLLPYPGFLPLMLVEVVAA